MAEPTSTTAPATPAQSVPASTPAPAAPNAAPAAVGGSGNLPPASVTPGTGGGVPNLGDMLKAEAAKMATEPTSPAPATPPATTPTSPAEPPAATPPATPATSEADARYAALEQRFNEQAEYNQRLTEYLRTIQPQQPAVPQVPATPAPAKSPTGVTPFDHRLMAFIKQGADGNLTLEAGAPPDTLIRYAEYQDSVKNFYRDFATKGISMFDDHIAERAAAIAQQKIDEYVQVRQAEQIGQQIAQQNEAWMYEKNPDGSRRQTVTGAPVLTAEGQKYMAINEYLKNNGTHPAAIPQVAQALMEGDVALRLIKKQQTGQPAPAAPVATPPATPAAPAAPLVDPKATFLQQAAAGAAVPVQPVSTPAPQRGPLRLHDLVKQHAPAFGVTLNN